MKFSRRFEICASAIEKRPIEDFDPPLTEEEKALYESDYRNARIHEEYGFDPNELKLGFYSDCYD